MSGRCEGCGELPDWCRGHDRCIVLRYERRTRTAEARVAELEGALREALDGWESLWRSDYNEAPPSDIDYLRRVLNGGKEGG